MQTSAMLLEDREYEIFPVPVKAAESAGIRNFQYLPDRTKFRGKTILKAFQSRNQQIVDDCDVLPAVWDGRSRGTANTLSYTRKVNKPVFLVRMEARRRGARSA